MYSISVLRKKISSFSEIWNLSIRRHDVVSNNTVGFVVTVGILGKPTQNSDIFLYVKEAMFLPTSTVTV